MISIFVNERVPDDSCESALTFLVRNGCVKGRKSEGLILVIWLKFGD